MNLKDLLSGQNAQAELYGQSDDINDLLQPAEPAFTSSILSPDADQVAPQDIYYLPTILTQIQRELIKYITRIFLDDLVAQIEVKRMRNSINSLLDSAGSSEDAPGKSRPGHSGQSNSGYNNISLLFGQILLVENYPSLLVDHFIPKKLLLSETNTRLITLSGKFQLFNRIIDSLIENSQNPGGFHLLVTAQSVKELELIEAVIIGKQLHYKNLSSSKLYEDNREVPNFKDENTPQSDKLCVHLITSNQLYNHFSRFPSVVEFNLIFSFDPKLDITNPSIQLLKSRSNKRLPIAIPVSVYSVGQIITQIPEPTSQLSLIESDFNTNPLLKWKADVVYTMIMNRNQYLNFTEEDEENFYLQWYGRRMERFAKWVQNGENEMWIQKLMNEFNQRLVVRFSEDQILRTIKSHFNANDYGIKSEVGIDYDNFKVRLVEAIQDEIHQMTEKAVEISKQAVTRREQESKRQLQHDSEEDLIASNYKKLRKLTEEASVSEKRLGKLDLELTKARGSLAESEAKYTHLVEYFKNKQVNDEDIKTQESTITQLKEELSILTSEYDKLDQENDSIRQKYQTSSSEAVQLSTRLAVLTDQYNKITNKLNGPGMRSLPSLIKRDTLGIYEAELNRVRSNNQFLSKFYDEKLAKLTKERQSIMEASASGSNSRPTNRMSRGTTPM